MKGTIIIAINPIHSFSDQLQIVNAAFSIQSLINVMF